MNTRSRQDLSRTTGARLRAELIFGSIWLAVGLFAVPAMIYWVGTTLLGPYGENAGMGTFYGAFFADLATGTGRTWLLALGPLLLVCLVRVVFIGVGRKDRDSDTQEESDPDDQRPLPAETRRVEPRIGQ